MNLKWLHMKRHISVPLLQYLQTTNQISHIYKKKPTLFAINNQIGTNVKICSIDEQSDSISNVIFSKPELDYIKSSQA